jgi:Fe-S oxidoreductase
MGAGYALKLPFEPRLAFAARDGAFTANLEQCNGCGGCLKQAPTMCPTFLVTGDEIMSTRGRANAIRQLLDHQQIIGDPLGSAELETALGNCLSCKACTMECPSNVNMALLKAELLHARIKRDGLTSREKLFSSVDFLGRLGCAIPSLSNALLESKWLRGFANRRFGLAAERPLPPFAAERFDHWFQGRQPSIRPWRGRVILWDDTFARYHEPQIGQAAVKVLETAGFEVTLATRRKCCGRPAFSQGNLDVAAEMGAHNLALFQNGNEPIIFLEPSCCSMFAEDYRELKLPDAERVAKRCILFEDFFENFLAAEPKALRFNNIAERIAVHAHCHAKALASPPAMRRLAVRLPERNVTLLDTGCCGMAGAFGMLQSKYELSLKVAEPLVQAIKAQPFGTTVVASGTSCRHQIQHLTTARVRHMAEVVADALS